ncbi:binary toxin-like calcium binding domain-containing protein [Bacillus thuringiensis]|uniref:binary toxin-like calcium binding domain-containing protein n=1 Tax=Bacillus thuringiensis TaxID=1428 RepID=UPI003CFBC7D1
MLSIWRNTLIFLTITYFLVSAPLSDIVQADTESAHLEMGQIIENFNGQKGLLGYYFNDSNFKKLVIITNQTTGDLSVARSSITSMIEEDKQSFKSAYWEGKIKIDEEGDYRLTTSSNSNVKLWIDGKLVINNSSDIQKINLKKEQTYFIQIEYQVSDDVAAGFDFKLYWTTPSNQTEIIPSKSLLLPETQTNLFEDTVTDVKTRNRRTVSDVEQKVLDSDGDKIPDALEINGYTVDVKNKKFFVTPWIETIHGKKNLPQYHSSPTKWSTASDPYSDLQKTTGFLDKQVKSEARHPLVAAYPIIGIDMEQIILSKNQEVSFQNGEAKNNTVSLNTSTSRTDTISQSVNASMHASLLDVGTSVSTSFTSENSATIGMEHSHTTASELNWSQIMGIDTGNAAYITAGIRYSNRGTAPIYRAKPTGTLILGENQSIATITAKENQLANVIKPNEYYPSKQQLPIALTTKDDFGSSPITLNFQQLQLLEQQKRLKIETNQITGQVGEVQENGEVQIKNDWDLYISQIQATSARLVIETGNETIERRITAIDPEDPQEMTKPEITLGEALELALGEKEIDGVYNKHELCKEHLEIIVDEDTAQNISKQLEQMSHKDIYQIKLQAKMNFLIKDRMLSTAKESLSQVKVYPKSDTPNTFSLALTNASVTTQTYKIYLNDKYWGESIIPSNTEHVFDDIDLLKNLHTKIKITVQFKGKEYTVKDIRNYDIMPMDQFTNAILGRATVFRKEAYNGEYTLEIQSLQAYEYKLFINGTYIDSRRIEAGACGWFDQLTQLENPNADIELKLVYENKEYTVFKKTANQFLTWSALTEEEVRKRHGILDFNFLVQTMPIWSVDIKLRFSQVPTMRKFNYKVVWNNTDFGTRPAPPRDLDGSVILDISDYHLDIQQNPTESIKVYAVDSDTKSEYLIAQYQE